MVSPFDSVVVRTSCQLLVPFMQVFALYVLFHGHYSPGGGFQAGAILSASVILTRLTQREHLANRYLPRETAVRLGALGVLVYGGVGLLPLFWGGEFLDYGRVSLLGLLPAKARYYGILGVEIGVALGVCGVMVSIFDDLAAAPPDEDG
jgi:multicomponent Na+:H+ antiporter subunit B